MKSARSKSSSTEAPNRPSMAELAKQWGTESKHWVGKQAIIEVRTDVIEGKDKDVIYLVPNDDGIPVVDDGDEAEKANAEAQAASGEDKEQ